jgi:phosphatidylglycerol---prolipoprotein diacylglyceryl transferase
MRPTLITLRGRRVPSYPAMLYLGVLFGMVAQNAAANAAGLPTARVYAATLVLFPVALVGARLLYVAGHLREYQHDPWQILDRASGGMAMYGGLLVMLPASVAVLAAFDLPYWRFWDVTSFLILLAMVWTRIGCLLNGCCAGRITSGRLGLWLSDVRGQRARRRPTQLLEATVAAALFAGASTVSPRLHRPGELFLLVVAGYGACRMVLQPLRAERARVDGILLLSLCLVTLSLAGLVLMRT